MTQTYSNTSLSNVQMELLKLYSTGVSDETLIDLKKTMAKFFLDRLRKAADKIWEEKAYSDAQMKKID